MIDQKQLTKQMPTTKTKTKAVSNPPIAITPPDFRHISIRLKGTSPLVINRFSQKAMIEMKATQEAGSTSRAKKVRTAKDFDALYEGAKHKSIEGWDGIHAASFRNAAISACRAVGFKMTHAKLAFRVMEDGWDMADGAPLVKILDGKAEQWIAPTRNATGVIDLRSRPMYRKWGARLNITYDAGMLSDADIVNLISRVGKQVGIGEGRPDSKQSAGLGFGLFDID